MAEKKTRVPSPTAEEIEEMEQRASLESDPVGYVIARMRDDGIPSVIALGDITYHLPYADLYPERAELRPLIEDIHAQGIITPIIVRPLDDGAFEVLDGATRLGIHYYLRRGSPLPQEIEDADDSRAFDLAVSLNAQRRQLKPAARREVMKKIYTFKKWRAWSVSGESRQADLARLLGVSEGTISQDIKKISAADSEASDAIETLKKERLLVRQTKSTLGRLIAAPDTLSKVISDPALNAFTDDEKDAGIDFVEHLLAALEGQSRALQEALADLKEE